MNRAYSVLNIKAMDDEEEYVSVKGIASTPSPDRMDDIVEPMGARFKTPMPLLLHHDSWRPVGTMDFARPKRTGIPFVASLPDVVELGVVRDRVLEAWHSLKYKLLGCVSIGFQPDPGHTEQIANGGYHFKEWDWLELSLVAIPANPDAVIQGFKSMDADRIRRALNIAAQPTEPRAAPGKREGVVYLGDNDRRARLKTGVFYL
jgi:hypothetical protein